jgi:hypothetical protein
LDTVLDWAAAEGWNPGFDDASAFWAADPHGFWAIEVEGDLVGSASFVVYGPRSAFAGLFLVTPNWRGRRVGASAVTDLFANSLPRLDPGATIAIDGVFVMQEYYASLGFRFTHRNLRMTGEGRKLRPMSGSLTSAVELSTVPFERIVAFDAEHFGARRPSFLRRWIAPTGGRGVALLDGEQIRGMGVVRPCRVGFKVGPLFAADESVAEALFEILSDHAAGEQLVLDIPECNSQAVALAERHGLQETFGCARMVMGATPDIPWQQVFGVTTFELG